MPVFGAAKIGEGDSPSVSGTDVLGVVSVAMVNPGEAGGTISGVTWDGVSMTRITPDGTRRIHVFVLANPSPGITTIALGTIDAVTVSTISAYWTDAGGGVRQSNVASATGGAEITATTPAATVASNALVFCGNFYGSGVSTLSWTNLELNGSTVGVSTAAGQAINNGANDLNHIVTYDDDGATGSVDSMSGTPQSGTYPSQAVILELSASTGLSASLLATGDGTVTDLVNEADTAVNLWQSIDDDPASPNDADWINNTDENGNGFVDLTNVPADFGTADSAEIIVRYRGQEYGAGNIKLHVQLFRADETTPLSDEVEATLVNGDSAFTDATVAFTGLDTAATKSVWDNAKLRCRWEAV